MIANPNHDFFDGLYQHIWQQIIPAQLTEKEVGHLIEQHGLNHSSRVLDLMCGYGRHSVLLAQQGISVTAIDNLAAYIQQLSGIQQKESLPIESIHASVFDWQPSKQYHWALCMGNSLNFFSPAELPIVLQKISDSLVVGGYCWINSWSLAEIALLNPMDGKCQSTQIGRYRHTNTFFLKQQPLRIEIESQIEDDAGNIEKKSGIDFLYTLDQLRDSLAAAGLTLLKTESVPGKKLFEKGDPRAYLLSQKLIK